MTKNASIENGTVHARIARLALKTAAAARTNGVATPSDDEIQGGVANPQAMTQAVYLLLLQLSMRLARGVAQADYSCDDFREAVAELGRLVSAAPWRATVLARIARRISNAGTLAGYKGEAIPSDAEINEGLQQPQSMPQALYLQLQALAERMDLEVAQGHDCVDGFDLEHAEVERLMDAAPWRLCPDEGCVPA